MIDLADLEIEAAEMTYAKMVRADVKAAAHVMLVFCKSRKEVAQRELKRLIDSGG